jgi:hypothetical protein
LPHRIVITWKPRLKYEESPFNSVAVASHCTNAP